MRRGKGWFEESKRHALSAKGVKTGRKVLPKKPVAMLVGKDQSMFYPTTNKEKRLEKKVSKTVEKLVALTLTEKELIRRRKLAYPNEKEGKIITVFGHKYIYNPTIEKMARTFFIKRFERDPAHPVEQRYFEEWRHRFYTGDPMAYMDRQSQRVYLKMLQGDKQLPKGWKGKGGTVAKIVEVRRKKLDYSKVLSGSRKWTKITVFPRGKKIVGQVYPKIVKTSNLYQRSFTEIAKDGRAYNVYQLRRGRTGKIIKETRKLVPFLKKQKGIKVDYPRKRKGRFEKTADKAIGAIAKFGEEYSEEETARFKRRRFRVR